VSQEETQDTRESPALDANEVQFSRADAESVGDPAAAGTDAAGDPGTAPVEPSGSPAAAQERAYEGDDSPFDRPEVQILGAFVGAFVLAKLLQWLFGRD
jgi:hypothetical protein